MNQVNTALKPLNILIVEDNEVHFYLLKEYLLLSTLNITVDHTIDVTQTLEKLDDFKADIIFLDLFLPDSDGLESFTRIQKKTDAAVIVVSGMSDINISLEALGLGAQDYLVKGEFNDKVLEKTVRYSLERKKTEQQILASEEKYRQIFYGNPFPMFIFDVETLKIVECNDAALVKYEYSHDEFLRLTVMDIRHVEDVEEVLPIIKNEENMTKLNRVWRHLKKSGELMLVEISYYPIVYEGRNLRQVQINDVTEKIRLKELLEEQQREKQMQITSATITAQEQERSELGRELHDNINQILVTSLLYLDYMITSKEVKFDLLLLSKNFVFEAISEIRKLSKTLVPPALDDVGLMPAIQNLITNLHAVDHFKIECAWNNFNENAITDAHKLTIYRIVQEQLNNIIKHAEATKVNIELDIINSELFLHIKDNGKGCDITKQSTGVGLQNINTRADLQNGKVSFNSTPGNGFKMEIVFALSDEVFV